MFSGHSVSQSVGVNNRWVSSREPEQQQLPLFVESSGFRSKKGGKVSQSLSSSEYLRDCVMAAGVTQHEELEPDSKKQRVSTTATAVKSKLQQCFVTGNKLSYILITNTLIILSFLFWVTYILSE